MMSYMMEKTSGDIESVRFVLEVNRLLYLGK